MSSKRALVHNAADPSQVKALESSVDRAREAELNDLRAVLALPAGRRLIWRLLDHCLVFSSVYDSSSKIYANAARQDVGHFIRTEIDEADDESLFLMMREAKEAKQQQMAEIEALRINAEREAEDQ